MDGATDTNLAISLRDITKAYGDAEPVVTGLNLDVAAGEIVALVGPSGCGKTTTLRMMNRLIEPTSGSITVLGQPQDAVPAHELRRHIGYVIQRVGLFPHLSIAKNIAVVPELLGWDMARIDARVRELVEIVGLDPELLDRYPRALSGGQQQRVGVARALAADPPILLMDEPFSAVDPIVRERLQQDLLDLQQRVSKTIVIVTHDVDEAIRLGDKMALMQVGGVLAQYDAPVEVLRNPANDFVRSFLGRERGLRQLSLMTVGDVSTSDGPVVDLSDSIGTARERAQRYETSWVAVIDSQQLRGWIPTAEFDGDDATTSVANAAKLDRIEHFVSWVTTDTSLREALDQIVTSRSQMAIVLDAADDSTYRGFVNVEDVAGGLQR